MVSLSGQEPVLLTYAIALGIVILILRMIMGVFASGNPFEYFSPEKDVKTWTVENFDDPEWNSPGGILLDEEYFQEIGDRTIFSLFRKVFYSTWSMFMSMIALAFLSVVILGFLDLLHHLAFGFYFYDASRESIWKGMAFFSVTYLIVNLIYAYSCLSHIFRFEKIIKKNNLYGVITRGLRQGEYISYYNNMICACPGFLLAADTSGIIYVTYDQLTEVAAIIQTGRNADYSYRAVRISADIDRKFNEMMPLPARIMNHVYTRIS